MKVLNIVESDKISCSNISFVAEADATKFLETPVGQQSKSNWNSH